ncbi:hypothetical protein GRF61_13190 [Azoarcus sp. TTM-91]|uniref:hypothetical protein n=1 Tax=Azoarcus sp. TTM-91 TaxID=2691581 RepID=UPI00145D0A22|nr:hypothetical protein [Azoarcus sp. TTM-91]NMG35400.1 hypothetical protein [Azoarcus sp. TTM-91]
MTLSITPEQFAIAEAYAANNDYANGWKYLASIGDQYAETAYPVASGDYRSPLDAAFYRLVQNHWENVAGKQAIRDHFESVAAQHYAQYIKYIYGNNYNLPDSKQIEKSYRDAVTDANLPPRRSI